MMSPQSISTQSAAGKPWTRAVRRKSAFILSAIFTAIDATCRPLRPLAITMKSAMLVLPASGMETGSTA